MARNDSLEQFKEAPLLEHLEELRWRIIYAVVFWLIGSGIAYFFRDSILAILKNPIKSYIDQGHNVKIVTMSITEPLFTVIQISFFGGVIIALPFIVYQIWAFVSPGLTKGEKRWGIPFILGLGFSFGLGSVFAYYVILPYAIPFLLSFLDGVENLLSVGQYITQIVTYMALFGLLFELPITIFLLTKVGLVNYRFLSRIRRIAIMVIVTASAIITPTVDPINLALMAVPLWILYEIGVFVSFLAERAAKRSLENEERII